MKVIRALLLVLALSICAFAGEMDNGRAGEMPNGKTGVMDNGRTSTLDPMTETALYLLQSILPLF